MGVINGEGEAAIKVLLLEILKMTAAVNLKVAPIFPWFSGLLTASLELT